MPLVKIKGNFQVTIPASIRRKWGIEVGDYIKVEESVKGILLKPVRIVESAQMDVHPQQPQDEIAERG